MRRTRPIADDRQVRLAELRRVVGVLANRPARERLTRLVDELEHDAGWDQVEEIRATQELERLRSELAAALADERAAVRAAEAAVADAGRLRRERDDARRQLAELRELARPDLADELVRLRHVLEHERPTSPPPLVLAQAERLTRAVRAT